VHLVGFIIGKKRRLNVLSHTHTHTHTQAYTARPTKHLQHFECLSTGFFRVKTITPTRVVICTNAVTFNVSSDITFELERLAVRNNSYRAHHKQDRFKEHVMIHYISDKSANVTSSGVKDFQTEQLFISASLTAMLDFRTATMKV
jgi:hypothetical protein